MNQIAIAQADNAVREQYYDEIRPLNLAPLWTVLKGLVPAQPVPAAKPCKWAWNDVYPQLLRAGARITADEAERPELVLDGRRVQRTRTLRSVPRPDRKVQNGRSGAYRSVTTRSHRLPGG